MLHSSQHVLAREARASQTFGTWVVLTRKSVSKKNYTLIILTKLWKTAAFSFLNPGSEIGKTEDNWTQHRSYIYNEIHSHSFLGCFRWQTSRQNKKRHFLMWAVIMHSTVDITPYMSKAWQWNFFFNADSTILLCTHKFVEGWSNDHAKECSHFKVLVRQFRGELPSLSNLMLVSI